VASLRGECPNLTFRVEGRAVRTTGATHFIRGCDELHDAVTVHVRGEANASGEVLATRVQVKKK
jgi:hypothetical protein